MKTNPIVYLFAILTLLIISALVFPGHITSSKPGAVASVAGNHKGIRRARVPSHSSSGKGMSAQDAASPAAAASDQIAELVLPGKKNESANAAGQGSSFVSTQATLFPAQESSPAAPQVVPLVGPVSQDKDLRTLPYVPPNPENEERRLTRHPPSLDQSQGRSDPYQPVKESPQPAAMPTPLATFGGMTSVQSGCSCLPPDTHGDVGPSHYIQSVNSSIKIFDKAGAALNGVNGTTYNSFFSTLGPTTPCGNFNNGDGFVFYDHLADRWVVSDFAFPGTLPGVGPFYQCVGVSKTSDPVAGGWWLYALQVDPANPTWVGDYPKLSLWPDAYYLSVNMFDGPSLAFEGVRVYALPRTAMINGTEAPNPGAVAFTVLPAGLGDSYSLVPATFRSGLQPPSIAGVVTPEYFMAIDSPATADVALTQVKTWRFHVDFATPANSTFGIGANRTPDGTTTVASFVDAFTSTTLLVPQNGTASKLDTLGDKLMTPLVYQNLAGTESLWVSHTINNNQNGTGPTAIRWYQFGVTGSTIPATPLQQETFNNATDGLWRFMPSLSVDGLGNMAIGYAASSSSSEPSIRYAGRFAYDPPNTLAQGEAVLIAGGGHQTSSSGGRWGDYSGTSIDPSDNCTFWHTNEYFSATSSAGWNTRIGTFKFPGCLAPTAAPATISGRITTTEGSPLAGVTMNLSGARSAKVISDSNGDYRFNNIDTDNFYTVTPTLRNYHFGPESQSFSLLGNKTDAVFTATRDAVNSGNAIDTADYFVRQHYLDFLGREPDESGFNFWSDQILSCGADAACIERRTINVSAAYFLSIEFQQTGGLVDGLYRASYGRAPRYAEFMPDTGVVGRDVVVGRADWAQQLEANKQAFIDAWVQRAAFQAAYGGLTNEGYVDTLISHTGVSFSESERAKLVSGLAQGTSTRANVLRQIAENERFVNAKRNATFVMMEYFGYLRRDPDANGYAFWLNKLNEFNGNFERAEMVKAFLVSAEYRSRFIN